MMNFLRKHQKKLFLAISIMTIASFTFFGTVNTMSAREIPDKEIAKAYDGSSIMERELHAMIRFLTLPSNDILKNDLMSSGLTAILAERYFDEIKDEFSDRLDKARRYTPYSHPQAPFLSATQVWNRFIPQLPLHLNEVKNGDLSPRTFAVYCQLYLDQADFPPEFVSRILQYQQQQYSWVTPDRELADPRRFVLFNAQSFEEWFGPRYTEVLGKFLFNSAIIAEKKGYKVSMNEARANLLQICLHTLHQSDTQREATFADANEFLRTHLQMAGVDETQAVKAWKKVMLVHRLFNDVGQGMLVDPKSYQEFAAFADEKATVEVYQLPEVLRLGDFRSLLKLHYYLEAVAPKMKNGLAELPRQFFTPAEVEKKTPELVVSRYDLEVAKINKEEVGSRLTLKETWDYEVSDEGWTKLKAEFPVLARGEVNDRLLILDGIDSKVRLKIDRVARSMIIDQHPEWIEEALSKVSSEKVAVAIRSKGAVAPFDEIDDSTELRSFLENAPLGQEAPLFSNDHQTYYRIVVLNKPVSKEVMTMKEALEGDWLGELVDKKLEAAYADVRKKEPASFKLENGSWKSFSDVRDQVGALVYADYLKHTSDQSLNEYAVKRLSTLMEGAKKNIETQGDQSPYLKNSGEPLVDQWKLVYETKEIKRSEATTLSKTEMFSAAAGNWSSVSIPHNGDLAFFKLLKKDAPSAASDEKIADGQRHLSNDAKRFLMHQLLEKFDVSP